MGFLRGRVFASDRTASFPKGVVWSGLARKTDMVLRAGVSVSDQNCVSVFIACSVAYIEIGPEIVSVSERSGIRSDRRQKTDMRFWSGKCRFFRVVFHPVLARRRRAFPGAQRPLVSCASTLIRSECPRIGAKGSWISAKLSSSVAGLSHRSAFQVPLGLRTRRPLADLDDSPFCLTLRRILAARSLPRWR